jgi:hypothetical protein
VIRERAAGAALLAFPPDLRERVGGEMTATLLDVSAGSRTTLIRELAGLFRGGLRARARRTAAAGAGRVVADGLCLASVWVMTLDLSTLLSQRVRGFEDPLLAPGSLTLLAAALALALVGYDRVAGALALAWTAARFPALLDHRPGMEVLLAAVTLPPVACFSILVIAPRRRARDPRRLAWLLVPVTLVATLGPPDYDQSPLLLAVVTIAAVLVAAYAVATVIVDPRVAIAAAVPLSTIALGTRPGAVLALTAPALLVLTVVRIRGARRPSPI